MTTRYWPARIARGGKVLAPGDGSDAYQTVDVNDVASLVMLAAELRWRGPWNATGPATPVTFGDYLQTCMRVTGTHPGLLWLDAAARERFKVQSDETPQWAPSSIVPGFQRISSAKARAAGWSTRSLEDSVRSTWLHHRENFPADYDFRRTGTGFSSERERTLLEALAAG
jgi:2'-hydroxyisoflavone reductase